MFYQSVVIIPFVLVVKLARGILGSNAIPPDDI